MLQKFNWRLTLGVVFIVLGVLSVFIDGGDWLNAGYGLVAGIGLLGIDYGQKHPERARGPLAWVLVIVWVVAFGGITLMRLQR